MVQYIDKFMDMCVSKIMPGEEKSQRRAVEQSGNKLKEVLTILSVSIENTNLAASQRPSASSNSASAKGALKDDAAKSTSRKGDAGCRQI